MARQSAWHDRVATGILDATATVLAERGPSASMNEIATAAGVGRATLYRYFPNRDALLAGLIRVAAQDLADRLRAAELEQVTVDVALGRLARAFLTAGAKYAVLAAVDKRSLEDADELELQVEQPVRALIDRGRGDGTLRSDLEAGLLFDALSGLLERGLARVMTGEAGIESASAAITNFFLHGAAANPIE